jgi:GntR family transcriptional regulator
MASAAESTKVGSAGTARFDTSLTRNGPRRTRPSLSTTVKERILSELILNGAVAPSERMPTEAELCERYEVSRITVRAALRSLRDAGYIDVRQGLGATVLPRAQTLASGLDQLLSLESQAAANGDVLTSADMLFTQLGLDSETAAKLSLAPGTLALEVRRVKLLRGVRAAWIVDYVPEGVLPFTTLQEEFGGSVLDVLMAHRELEVEYSDASLTAIPAGAALAKRLAVRPGTPVVSLEEVTLTRAGTAINLSECWMLPQYFSLSLRRRRGLS